jgi:hypothetical protein
VMDDAPPSRAYGFKRPGGSRVLHETATQLT